MKIQFMQEGNEDQVMIEDIGEMIDLLVKDIVMKNMTRRRSSPKDEDLDDNGENPGLEVWSPETDRSSNYRGRAKRGRNSRRYDNSRRKGGPRECCTLLVKNIPKENNSISSLNEHFQQFGTIVNIDVSFTLQKKKREIYIN